MQIAESEPGRPLAVGRVSGATPCSEARPAECQHTEVIGLGHRDEACSGRRGAQLASDRRLFSSFEACLPSGGTVRFLDHHHMGKPFEASELAEIRRFCACWRGRGHEFGDWRLERFRRRLLRLGTAYLRAVDELTEIGPDGLRAVPRVWLEDDPARFDSAVYTLNRLADRVVRCYRKLHRMARARLSPTARG